MAKFGINDILNAKTKAAGQQAQGYKEIYLSPYEVKAAEENTHQKLEGIEELADSFLHVGQEQPTVLARVNGEYRIIDGHRRNEANKDNPNLFKDTRWLLTLLINEALLAEDENAQLLEEKRVGRLIHAGNLQEVQNAIFKSFYRGTAGDNSDTENENDGEETTEEGNRAAVQEN